MRKFIYSVGVIMLITALAKLLSSAGESRILQTPDPILAVSFRKLFVLLGAVELVAAMICFFGKSVWLQSGLIAWLATNFVVYRLGLLWMGYHKPCGCMGNLTDALGLSPQRADMIMKIALAYMLVGSYACLIWLWRQGKKSAPSTPPTALGTAEQQQQPSA